MYTIYIYNNGSNRLERYRLEPYQNMPYTSHDSMFVSEFFSNTRSEIGWSSSDFLIAWSNFSKGRVRIKSAFRRISEGGHIAQSMHYAGLAADTDSGDISPFPYVESGHVGLYPASYPVLSYGDIGPFVLVMQDALISLGFSEVKLDGFFGHETAKGLLRFLDCYNISPQKLCDHSVWQALTLHATGCGGLL